jgi:hypothetical protein
MANRTFMQLDEQEAEPESPEMRAVRLADEPGRIAKARRSAAAGRRIPLTDIQAWADSLCSQNALPLPRTRR